MSDNTLQQYTYYPLLIHNSIITPNIIYPIGVATFETEISFIPTIEILYVNGRVYLEVRILFEGQELPYLFFFNNKHLYANRRFEQESEPDSTTGVLSICTDDGLSVGEQREYSFVGGER